MNELTTKTLHSGHSEFNALMVHHAILPFIYFATGNVNLFWTHLLLRNYFLQNRIIKGYHIISSMIMMSNEGIVLFDTENLIWFDKRIMAHIRLFINMGMRGMNNQKRINVISQNKVTGLRLVYYSENLQ